MGELRIATWNVENLFEAGADDGPPDQAAFEAKLASLAAVIDATRPHVLALQEVGPEPALVALRDALSWSMPHMALGVPDTRGIRVAFLATRQLTQVTSVALFPPGLLPVQVSDDPPGPTGPTLMNQLGRPALQARVRANNADVTVLTCHLKSKLLTYPNGRFQPVDEDERARYATYALFRRSAEAASLRAHLNGVLDGHGPERAVILCGDLNDEVDAATTQILNGPSGSEIGTAGFDRPDKGDGDRMWNLAPLIPGAERSSRVYRGRPELIDHVFASHYLVNGKVESVSTRRAEAQLPSVTDEPSTRRGEPGSDHAAVVATFDW